MTTLWYLTRGSGVVALVLLTATTCLGIAGALRVRTSRVPRFAVGAIHRNLSLLAIVFVVVHVVTSVADTYTPIGLKDAFIPFASAYRPIWLGLGAVAFDVLLAIAVTSMLRARLGYRAWRATHWAAYACWPIALVHSLGTGSDPRAGFMQVTALVSIVAVAFALAARLIRAGGDPLRRLAFAGSAAAFMLVGALWYRQGPGAHGWAAAAGTPSALLKTHATLAAARTTSAVSTMPTRFNARLTGTLTESSSGGSDDGFVDVHLDGRVVGSVKGSIRLVLRGVPIDGGGVSMTASGVAFSANNSPVYEGQIVALQGTQLAADVTNAAGSKLRLALVLRLDPRSNRMTGTVTGTPL
jgi:hypothetical protein